MKRWSIILGVTLVVVWIVVDVMRSLPDAIQYFSAQPRQLYYVAAIAIVGGLIALGFDRLSPRAKRQVSVFAWGAGASTMTAFLGWFVFQLAPLSSQVIESGGGGWVGGWVILALLSFGSIAAYLWFEFCRSWKAGV